MYVDVVLQFIKMVSNLTIRPTSVDFLSRKLDATMEWTKILSFSYNKLKSRDNILF